MSNKKTVSFSLKPNTVERIEELCTKSKLKKSNLIELLIENADLNTVVELITNNVENNN